MRLFHFSDRSDIAVFEPRSVAVPAARRPGEDWLAGPLVWAIDAWHQPLYLFPRDCPRILVWPVPSTTAQDRSLHWRGSACRMIAHIERAWLTRLVHTVLYRYEFPDEGFQFLGDAGMAVSRRTVAPIGIETIRNLPGALDDAQIELRVLPSLKPLQGLWATSLHVSGIRLRNARD